MLLTTVGIGSPWDPVPSRKAGAPAADATPAPGNEPSDPGGNPQGQVDPDDPWVVLHNLGIQ